MGSLSKNIGMDEVKNQKILSEYFAGKSDFKDSIISEFITHITETGLFVIKILNSNNCSEFHGYEIRHSEA